MLPLFTQASITGAQGFEVLKVLTLEEARNSAYERSKCLIWHNSREDSIQEIVSEGWRGVFSPQDLNKVLSKEHILVGAPKSPGVVAPGDVIRLIEGKSSLSVLYRRGANSNTLFTTERCNSHCIMCSQPPREIDDQWRVGEILETIPLIDRSEQLLGISGGEPTLLGDRLLEIILQAKQCLENTELHILSNGRRFADESFAKTVSAVGHPAMEWGIPVYSDCPETHDYIVQSTGAWDETLSGLYNLAKYKNSIEIRVVIQKENVQRLGELAYFIFRNLSFAKHVAFMGIEPIGFARANRKDLWIAPRESVEPLSDAVFFLANRGINVSIYNVPLCMLPDHLWSFCQKSISDWKNIYLPDCSGCQLRGDCCGFFQSEDGTWARPKTHSLIEIENIV